MGAQAQDLSAFQTLPTETGKGIVTSLNDNNTWVAFKAAPGYNLGEATWAKFNNPWGGNGRVYLECTGQDAETGFYKYIIAGQGRFITGFKEDGNKQRPTVGAKGQAREFLAEYTEETDEATGVVDTILRFKDPATGLYLYADNGNGNNILSLNETDAKGWQIGTWRGVTFARLDVKPYNGDATGTAIKPCNDGYYYGTLYLPFAVIVPDSNDTSKYPNIANGDKVVNVWKLGGYADEPEVTPAYAGDTIPGGTPILVRATGMNVDFPYIPTSTYVDRPSTESFFTGYYTEAPEGEQFQLTLDAGYPKFERANVMVDKNNNDANHKGEMRQAAVNIGYILANNDNDGILEYRFNFEDMTLKGYENPDYKLMLSNQYETLLHSAGTQPFSINPTDTTRLLSELANFPADATEDDYNNFIEEIKNSCQQPDEAYISLKNGTQSIGDRGEGNRKGLFSNFNTPNGANGRLYFKKVADNQYQVGVNGRWLQAPRDGEDVDNGDGTTTYTTYQVGLETEPVTFDINVVGPGQITISKDDIAVAKGGNDATVANDETTTNKGGIVIGAPLYEEDENGNQAFNANAIWTVNEGFTGVLTLDARDASYQFHPTDSTTATRYLGTICEPAAIAPDLDADGSAQLYKVVYDADDNLELKAVQSLEAGEPGVISSTRRNTVKVNLLNGFVTAPKSDDKNNALIGILNFSTTPADGQYANPHKLGIYTQNDTTSTYDAELDTTIVTVTTTQSLVFTTDGFGYDINKAFLDGGQNAENIPLNVAELVTGIKDINNNRTPVIRRNDDAIYNLSGQRVGSDYKGIIIKNGKKYINK